MPEESNIAGTPPNALGDTPNDKTLSNALESTTKTVEPTTTTQEEVVSKDVYDKLELHRRDLQSERDKLNAQLQIHQDLIQQGVYVHRDVIPHQPQVQSQPQQTQEKAIAEFMPQGQQFNEEEVNQVGTASWQALEKWRAYNTQQMLDQKLAERDKQTADQQRLEKFNSEINSLAANENIKASTQELQHFQTVFLPNIAKYVSLEDAFLIYRNKFFKAPPPVTMPNKNVIAPTTIAAAPTTRNRTTEELLARYEGTPDQEQALEYLQLRGGM